MKTPENDDERAIASEFISENTSIWTAAYFVVVRSLHGSYAVKF